MLSSKLADSKNEEITFERFLDKIISDIIKEKEITRGDEIMITVLKGNGIINRKYFIYDVIVKFKRHPIGTGEVIYENSKGKEKYAVPNILINFDLPNKDVLPPFFYKNGVWKKNEI